MSDDASRSGSETSLRSSLRGWSSMGVTPKSRDEIDVTRTSASSYTSSRALPPAANLTGPPAEGNPQGAGISSGHPSSSPCLNGPSSSRKLSEAPGEGKPIEHQIKQERIWWSEQTLFEVQKMELALKQELHKTTAGLREQFRRQLEIERNEAQQRSAAFDRTLSRLREDLETLRETQDASSRVRQLTDGFAQAEASMRLEVDAMRCTVEDYHRQHNEELSVRLAAFDADRARLMAATNSLREDLSSMKDRLAAVEANASTDAKKASENGGMVNSQQFETLRTALRSLEESVEEERTARMQTVASSAAKSAGDSALAAELHVRLQELEKSMDSEHSSRSTEVSSLRRDMEDVAKEVLKLRDEESTIRESLKTVERRLSEDGGSSLAELTQLLQIECKSRKNDVEELHQQLRLTEAWISERSGSENPEVQQTLTDLDMRVGRLVSALETERDHRRSDVDRYSAAVTDVMDALKAERTLRANELEKIRGALAQLTLNLQSAMSSETTESQQKIAAAFASLATALDKEVSGAEADKAGDGSSPPRRGRAATAELVAEVTSRLEVLAASLRGEITAKAAELRGDMAATRAELLRKIEDNHQGSEPGTAVSGGSMGQTSTAMTGQLNEVVRLVQVIASGTEHLGEKLCDEVAERRQSEVTLSNRLSRVEHRVFELSGKDPGVGATPQTQHSSEFFPEGQPPPVSSPMPSSGQGGQGGQQQIQEVFNQQTVVSENLKDNLEQLVTRINRMLKPGQAQDGRPSRNRSSAQSREPSAQAVPGMGPCPGGGHLVNVPDVSQVLKAQTVVSESLKDDLELLVTRVQGMLKPGQGQVQLQDGRDGRRSPSRNRSTAQSREPSAQTVPGMGPCPGGRLVSVPDPSQVGRPSVGSIKTAPNHADLTGSCAVPCSTPVNRAAAGCRAPVSTPGRPSGGPTAAGPPAAGFPGSFVAAGTRPAGPALVPGPAQGGCRPMRPQVSLQLQQAPGKAPPFVMGQGRSMQVRPH